MIPWDLFLYSYCTGYGLMGGGSAHGAWVGIFYAFCIMVLLTPAGISAHRICLGGWCFVQRCCGWPFPLPSESWCCCLRLGYRRTAIGLVGGNYRYDTADGFFLCFLINGISSSNWVIGAVHHSCCSRLLLV